MALLLTVSKREANNTAKTAYLTMPTTMPMSKVAGKPVACRSANVEILSSSCHVSVCEVKFCFHLALN